MDTDLIMLQPRGLRLGRNQHVDDGLLIVGTTPQLLVQEAQNGCALSPRFNVTTPKFQDDHQHNFVLVSAPTSKNELGDNGSSVVIVDCLPLVHPEEPAGWSL